MNDEIMTGMPVALTGLLSGFGYYVGEIDLTIADAQDLIAAVLKRMTEFFPA